MYSLPRFTPPSWPGQPVPSVRVCESGVDLFFSNTCPCNPSASLRLENDVLGVPSDISLAPPLPVSTPSRARTGTGIGTAHCPRPLAPSLAMALDHSSTRLLRRDAPRSHSEKWGNFDAGDGGSIKRGLPPSCLPAPPSLPLPSPSEPPNTALARGNSQPAK